MAKLTREQPETLLKVIEFAHKHGKYVPTAKQLAGLLTIHERAASARLKRLIDSQADSFVRDGKTCLVNYDAICTEPESARLLLLIYQNCSASTTGRVSVSVIAGQINSKNKEGLLNLIEIACKAGYLMEIPASPQEVRASAKTSDHLEFLKKLAKMG